MNDDPRYTVARRTLQRIAEYELSDMSKPSSQLMYARTLRGFAKSGLKTIEEVEADSGRGDG